MRSSADQAPGFGDGYILDAGSAGHRRLHALCAIHDPHSRRLLEDAGLAEGARFAEFGCGLGYVLRWAAARGAEATGVDLSASHLAEARRLAESEGVRVNLRNESVYAHTLAEGGFDIVYCRFVLSHLDRRVDALRAMARALRPGGLLVCEEPDLATLYAEPPCDGYRRLLEAAMSAGTGRGLDRRCGRRLHLDAAQAGLDVVAADAYQLHYLDGAEKGFWTWTFAEASSALREAGELSSQELDVFLADMRAADADPRTLVGHPRIHQMTARKPG